MKKIYFALAAAAGLAAMPLLVWVPSPAVSGMPVDLSAPVSSLRARSSASVSMGSLGLSREDGISFSSRQAVRLPWQQEASQAAQKAADGKDALPGR